MLAGLKDQANKAKEAAAKAATDLQERVEHSKAGKEMIDRGGPEAEALIIAKQLSNDIAARDRDLIASLQLAISSGTNAAAKLRETSAVGPIDGIGGQAEFETFASQYDGRVTLYQRMLADLGEPVGAAAMTIPEKDAEKIIRAKGKYTEIKGAAGSVINQARGSFAVGSGAAPPASNASSA